MSMVELDSKIHIGKNVIIEDGVQFPPPFKLDFKPNSPNRKIVDTYIGTVYIGDNCYIGANSVIQRGWEKATYIGPNTWLANSVTISHDCVLNERVCITMGAVLCGHVEVGRDSYIGTMSVVRQWIHIGERSMIGMGSVVTKNIPDGVIAWGNPCRVHKENKWIPPYSEDIYSLVPHMQQ